MHNVWSIIRCHVKADLEDLILDHLELVPFLRANEHFLGRLVVLQQLSFSLLPVVICREARVRIIVVVALVSYAEVSS